jgi:hypothetical protein
VTYIGLIDALSCWGFDKDAVDGKMNFGDDRRGMIVALSSPLINDRHPWMGWEKSTRIFLS